MRTLTITLDLQLPAWEIPNLRAAIAERVGYEYELFHMHNNNPEEGWDYHTHYPLIQFCINRDFVEITGIEAGAEALQSLLLPKLTEDWVINNRKVQIPGYNVTHGKVKVPLDDEVHSFRLYQWQAMNQKRYRHWDAARDNEEEQLKILSEVLTGHFRSFAEGINYPHSKEDIIGKVTKIFNRKKVKWHGVSLMTFDIEAESYLKVPYGIGIGRLSAYGFGRTGKVRMERNRKISKVQVVQNK